MIEIRPNNTYQKEFCKNLQTCLYKQLKESIKNINNCITVHKNYPFK